MENPVKSGIQEKNLKSGNRNQNPDIEKIAVGFWKNKCIDFRSFCEEDVVKNNFKDLPLFRNVFERFGVSNCRKLNGFAQNVISGT